ncbi:MAG: nucleotide pyrophosphohydrolase [Parcubacteria group bacterium]|jgi:NTP pyrophosphatase (non-canonical NTP hydrolase)
MDIKELSKRAIEIKEKYHQLEQKKYGKKWTNAQVMEGFVGDVGDLMKLVMAKEGIGEADDLGEKLAHELADYLYCVLVLSEKYGIDIEKAFLKTMEDLDEGINKKLE